MSKRIGLVTCRKFPRLTPDDLLLVPALQKQDLIAEAQIWDEPTDWKRFDAIIVRSAWDYYLHIDAFRAWLDAREKDGIPFWNPIPVLRRNIDKTYLKELEAKGIPIVPTRWLGAAEQLEAELQAAPWDDMIVKPIISADSFHTYRVRRSEMASELPAVKRAARRCPLMVQPFVSSVQTRGEISLIFLGGEFSHCVIKRPAPGDFRVQMTHGGNLQQQAPEREWHELAERILSVAAEGRKPGEIFLYARVDLLEWEGKPVLGELELTEPSLYLGACAEGPGRFAAALARTVKR